MTDRCSWLLVFLLVLSFSVPGLSEVRAADTEGRDTDTLVQGRVLVVDGGETRPLKDARVFLTGVPGGLESTDPPVMDQVDETFVPGFLGVRRGTRVVFKNSDTVSHNVRLVRLPDYKRVLNRYVYHGDTLAHRFEETGLVQVECDVHPLMEAHVVVLEERFLTARSGPDGRFEFGVSSAKGTLAVLAWHPSYGLSSPRSVDPEGPRSVRVVFRP